MILLEEEDARLKANKSAKVDYRSLITLDCIQRKLAFRFPFLSLFLFVGSLRCWSHCRVTLVALYIAIILVSACCEGNEEKNNF